MRDNFDLAIALLRDHDGLAKVSDTAINLNLVLEELLEGGDVEDLVTCGLRSVDNELFPLAQFSPTKSPIPIGDL